MTKSGNFERALAIVVALGVVAISVFLSVAVRIHRINDDTMHPALPAGSRAIIVAATTASRGDVITFFDRKEPEMLLARRVIAVGGDEVRIVHQRLYVNGREVPEPYVVHKDPKLYPNYGPYRVPPGRYFVLGDNRDQSSDSRYWGAIPPARLGRVRFVFAGGGFRKV